MAYTTPRVWSVGEGLTAAKMQAISDNFTYLKSQTDQIYVAVYNNDASTLNQNDAVVIDPSYTTGLAVKTSTVVGDMRAVGVVISASISSHSTGIVAFGRLITQINVNGAVVFGHSLIIGANAHYAQDSGGGGTGYGVIGFALAANASGNATIAVLLDPHPLFMTAAQVITQKYGANDFPSGGATIISNAVNIAPNQVMLFFTFTRASGFTVPLWNGQTPTQVQAAANNAAYIGYLLGAGPATANFTGNITVYTGAGIVLALNGINQGGGAATFGTWVHQNSPGASISLTVTCVPGDKVIGAVTIYGTAITFTGKNQTTELSAAGTNTALDVQSAVATGTSVTFTWTVGGAIGYGSVDGVALHSA
jgi:hypothetical protein